MSSAYNNAKDAFGSDKNKADKFKQSMATVLMKKDHADEFVSREEFRLVLLYI